MHMKLSNVLVNKMRGFTFIEISIAIAILALISTIIFNSVSSSRAKMRDTLRIKDAEALYTAAQMYGLDNGSAMPDSNTTSGVWRCLGDNNTCWTGTYTNDTALNAVFSQYIDTIPDDPRNDTSCQGDAYLYSSSVPTGGGLTSGTWLHWYAETGNCGPAIINGSANACGTPCYLKVSDYQY